MPTIKLNTLIQAPIQTCFDLSRSVDVHVESTSKSGERAVAGVTSGLMELNDEVTWEAVHFGVRQRFTSRITEYESPVRFVDEMVRGAFKRFRHVHEFESADRGTLMADLVEYVSPLGLLGRLADWLVVKRYLTRLLEERNNHLKRLAESGR